MKLRYYLRGLGIGLLIATIIMMIANAGKRPLSDAEIRTRAMELGMVDKDSIKLPGSYGDDADAVDVNASEQKGGEETKEDAAADGIGSADGAEGTDKDAAGEATEAEPIVDETKNAQDEGEPVVDETKNVQDESETVADETKNVQDEGEPATEVGGVQGNEGVQPITIVIKGGTTSYSVSKSLAEAGLVESADAFDAFLCNNGYARLIRPGTYEIFPGSSEEEIAKLIAG